VTAIVGVTENGKVWIGGDSAGCDGLSVETRTDPKVFINGEFVFGYTSSFRMGQLLQYVFTPPTPVQGQEGMAYMVKQFIPAVKSCLADGGFQTNEKGQDIGGCFLVGHKGQLYSVECDYQVARVHQPYHACGCGKDIALGSLFSTEQLSPEQRINAALTAASTFSAGVKGPFTVLSI
jgi:ATP-dependent protease HslVU (ClpYQ) peptidase subunit